MSETVSQKSLGRPRKYSYPATLTCTVSGVIVKTNPTQFASQLAKSGLTQEEYIKTYVCRAARKAARLANGDTPVAKVPRTPRVKKVKVVEPVEECDEATCDDVDEPTSDDTVELPVGGSKVWGEIDAKDEEDGIVDDVEEDDAKKK